MYLFNQIISKRVYVEVLFVSCVHSSCHSIHCLSDGDILSCWFMLDS